MATNKWLSDMQTLKATTDTLRNTLRDKNVVAYDTDTLPALVNKVPNLAPIEIPEDEKWKPDPLWKFPDPNGTGTTKTIREIYDEDALASTYTYRGIYQLRGDFDTVDLKKSLNESTASFTFILSDGTTYTDISETSLVHTWDKTKDIIDSKGISQRYIKVYCTAPFSYIPGFQGQVVWYIHNLGTVVNAFTSSPTIKSYYTDIRYCNNLECAEIENAVRFSLNPGISAESVIYGDKAGYCIKLIIKQLDCGNRQVSSGNVINSFYNIKLKEIYIYGFVTTSNGVYDFSFIYGAPNLKILKITDEGYASLYSYSKNLSSLIFCSPYNGSATGKIPESLKIFPDLNGFTHSISTVDIYNLINLIELPKLPNVAITTLHLNNLMSIKNIIIPATVKTAYVADRFYNLERLVINSTTTSVYFTMTTLTHVNYKLALKEVVIPIDYEQALNLSYCPNLTHMGIVNLLNNLKDLTGETAKTITLGSVNLAKLTDEEKAIATNKNWTLA